MGRCPRSSIRLGHNLPLHERRLRELLYRLQHGAVSPSARELHSCRAPMTGARAANVDEAVRILPVPAHRSNSRHWDQLLFATLSTRLGIVISRGSSVALTPAICPAQGIACSSPNRKFCHRLPSRGRGTGAPSRATGTIASCEAGRLWAEIAAH